MVSLTTVRSLLLTSLSVGLARALNYTDDLVAPDAANYTRYVTFLGVGSRIYTCDPTNATLSHGLAGFSYDLYDAETDTAMTTRLGQRVFVRNKPTAYAVTDMGFFTY